jgi:putative transcriptional regulator
LIDTNPKSEKGYLAGQVLIAMPHMPDPRFDKSLIFLCVHNREGAMGIVINRLNSSITYPDLLSQLGLPSHLIEEKKPVYYGGPVEMGRGFVLHSDEFVQESTLQVYDGLALTATVDILRAIAEGRGPKHSLLALGYAGWGAGQLEQEIHHNAWLTAEPDMSLLFEETAERKYQRAMSKIGVTTLTHLSGVPGHA